jgi:hypothetical protein
MQKEKKKKRKKKRKEKSTQTSLFVVSPDLGVNFSHNRTTNDPTTHPSVASRGNHRAAFVNRGLRLFLPGPLHVS